MEVIAKGIVVKFKMNARFKLVRELVEVQSCLLHNNLDIAAYLYYVSYQYKYRDRQRLGKGSAGLWALAFLILFPSKVACINLQVCGHTISFLEF